MVTSITAIFGLAAVIGGASGDLSVEEIVKRTNHAAYYQGNNGRARVSMVITDGQGRKRERELSILRYDAPGPDGEQKFYLYFHAPADVARMPFLVHKHLDRADARWLYIPALDLVKRIAATDKRTSFVGSDFLYEDVSGRQLDQDHHELLKTTENFYLLKHTPKDPDSVKFAHYTMWIHKKSFLPTKVEYSDASGEVYRVMTVGRVETIDGKPTVLEATMEDRRTGSRTVLTYKDPAYDIGVPERVFTERYLRRAPVKYLK